MVKVSRLQIAPSGAGSAFGIQAIATLDPVLDSLALAGAAVLSSVSAVAVMVIAVVIVGLRLSGSKVLVLHLYKAKDSCQLL